MSEIIPFSLKDAPALIEKLLPVQKLSAESYKEQMAVHGKTLTGLGSYWKGRKPLILNKACILGCLLPATGNNKRDLEIFEKLMAMDDDAFKIRIKQKSQINDFLKKPYRERVEASYRPEEKEVYPRVFNNIWNDVNAHLKTEAHSFPELIEQLGVMRFGHRPKLADTFCGSGQIPFEAARLGCEVYASDLNPIACLLTWGAFHIVGGSTEARKQITKESAELIQRVQTEVDELGIETDGSGWRGKVYLYCLEAICPQTGWRVPLMPSRLVSQGYRVVAKLKPIPAEKRYAIEIISHATYAELKEAEFGTVRKDSRGQDPYMIHTVDGREYKTNISTLRGDYTNPEDGSSANRLRQWEVQDFKPRPDDIFQERLYCVQWMRPKGSGKQSEYEFRAVTEEDLARERKAEAFIAGHLEEWQVKGYLPDMRIEPGAETARLKRERGWTYWHHLFNPRQLLLAGLVNQSSLPSVKVGLPQGLNWSSRLSAWNRGAGGGGIVTNTFSNQALNTLYDYGCRGWIYLSPFFDGAYKSFPIDESKIHLTCQGAKDFNETADLFITDPPYGDAVHYEEILDFFIAWLRKNSPKEFQDWVWDSRKALAIKGNDEDFRQGMVAAYKRMTERMTDNGMQIIMFTHQSGALWADMANIVWASGLQVTAAWYVATESDSALRQGSNVKGTVLLVLRKRTQSKRASRSDLAWEIKEEVERQVQMLTGLNQQVKASQRDENVFEDVDLQMAGYAAALRVLTQYTTIDGKDMPIEALRPREKGKKSFVDELIDFAVNTANEFLVPTGIEKRYWDRLSGAERFYLKMLQMEANGSKSLDNYQNFAKAFKVQDFKVFMASQSANSARLKSAAEFGKSELGEGSQLYGSLLRVTLYALIELINEVPSDEVIAHLRSRIDDWYDGTKRDFVIAVAEFIGSKVEGIRAKEASAARVLCELIRTEKLG